MAKSPRLVGKEIVSRLEKAGFFVTKIKDSHYRLKHSDGRQPSVPVYAGETIGVGLLHKIVINDCKLNMEDFEKL